MLLFFTFDWLWNPKKIIVFSTIIIMICVPWTAKQHIRVISEWSCDTENWINDSENSTLIIGINYIWRHNQIQNIFF